MSGAGLMQTMMAWLKRSEKRMLVCNLELVPSCDILTLSGRAPPNLSEAILELDEQLGRGNLQTV